MYLYKCKSCKKISLVDDETDTCPKCKTAGLLNVWIKFKLEKDEIKPKLKK